MKKQGLLITIAVMSAACFLLIGNAIIVSGFLLKPDKVVEQKTLESAENLSYSKENVPVLKLEPAIPVSSSYDYLTEVMTQDEIQMIQDFMDNSTNMSSDSTRHMTDSENNRFSDLQFQYSYEGLRPENHLPLIDGNYDVYLDIESEIYYYPEREMTDEELLQVIDWRARVNYALSLRYEQPKPSSIDITETEAIALAIESIEKLFGVDTSALKVTATFVDLTPLPKKQWAVTVNPHIMPAHNVNGEAFWIYLVLIDPLSGYVVDTTRICPTLEKTLISKTDMESILNDISWLETAESVVIDKQGEKRKVKDVYITNPIIVDDKLVNDNFNSERGTVDVAVVLEDGAVYTVSLYYPDKSLRCLTYAK